MSKAILKLCILECISNNDISAEVACKSSFSNGWSLASVAFESNSTLPRIEESGFAGSGLNTIQIPASVEVVCKSCFSTCKSLASLTLSADVLCHDHAKRLKEPSVISNVSLSAVAVTEKGAFASSKLLSLF
jgi:hypothetical protein